MGCDSIYQRGHTLMPPDPCAQLALRMEEARTAEKAAEQGSAKLRRRLAQGLPRDTLSTDIDRVHAAALELERRIASVQDAAAWCQGQPQVAAEIARLQQQARDLLAVTNEPSSGQNGK